MENENQIFCSICQEFISIPRSIWNHNESKGVRKGVYVHGSPIHALILYFNSEGKIVSHELSQSIQLNRDGRVLSQLSASLHDQSE